MWFPTGMECLGKVLGVPPFIENDTFLSVKYQQGCRQIVLKTNKGFANQKNTFTVSRPYYPINDVGVNASELLFLNICVTHISFSIIMVQEILRTSTKCAGNKSITDIFQAIFR